MRHGGTTPAVTRWRVLASTCDEEPAPDNVSEVPVSGGGDPSGGGGPSIGGDPTPCGDLVIDAQLHSVNANVSVDVDDLLAIELDSERIRIIAVNADGETVGAIAAGAPRLLECLRTGTVFAATVTHADGGDVRVRVEAT